MRAGVAAAMVAASIAGAGPAWSACTPGRLGGCINLDLVPQVSQQVVADEPGAAPPKKTFTVDAPKPYTGPIVGAAPNVRRAPTVGYKWSLE